MEGAFDMEKSTPGVTRRDFLSTSLAAGPVVSAAISRRVLGANDRIRLGVIGSGGRSQHLTSQVNQLEGFEWVAVSDVWEQRCRQWEEKAGVRVEKYQDYRKLLDRNDIDGVLVGTFDHVHAQITADACRAGKDVYVEKPMTSLPDQGLEVVQAVRETKRIVQVGMQQRSMPCFVEAKERFIDNGRIGDVHMVRTIWNKNAGYTVKVPSGMEKKPKDLDWEACLAWLPSIPWDPKRYFNRFAYWDFSTGGMTGGLFVHMVDVAHWYLGLQKCESAVGLGGIYHFTDGRDTPDNINLVVTYPNRVNITFEASITDLAGREVTDIVFMGTGGRLSIFRRGYRFITRGGGEEISHTGSYGSSKEHLANWLDCMRSRKPANATEVDGHYSAMACHMGNVAYQKRTCITWQKEWDV
jgi:predicted dehydrogenase